MTTDDKNLLSVTLDRAAEELQAAWCSEGNFARTIAYGVAVNNMREALTPAIMRSLLKLKNCKLGFKTDESPGNVYSEACVRDCIIDAATMGLQCVGNHFNIIGGNTYVTKEGFTYLLRQLVKAGRLRDMQFNYHPATISESSTAGTRRDGTPFTKIEREGTISVDVRWTLDDVPHEESLKFTVRVNAGMTQDAIIGKAERKAKKWLFEHITDQYMPDGEAEPEPMRNVTPAAREEAPPAAKNFLHGLAEAAGAIALPGAEFGKVI